MTDQAPCQFLDDDAHNETCPFCGALPQAKCRHEPSNEDAEG